MSRESNRLKKSSSWFNSSNALIQHLRGNAFLHFSVLPGSAETQVFWCGIVKCLLITCFIGNICAKKYQNPFTSVKVIASQRWDVSLRHGVESFRGCLCKMPLVLDDTAIFTALADSDSIWDAVFDEV